MTNEVEITGKSNTPKTWLKSNSATKLASIRTNTAEMFKDYNSAVFTQMYPLPGATATGGGNIWGPDDIDKLEIMDTDQFRDVVSMCRFFYKHDVTAASVVNKIVEIGINEITMTKNDLSQNEFAVFESLTDELREFAEDMAFEFLLSGLVIPEVKYAPVTKQELKLRNIKKYTSLTLPVSMWLRDPNTVIIESSPLPDKPSIFVEIPGDFLFFIRNDGAYPDGNVDKQAFLDFQAYYPEFVLEVKNGKTKFLIDNRYVIRRRHMTDSPYPVPYLYPALETMKHKRNLRRMDYSISARVISAILLFKLGSDMFPITEDNQIAFDELKQQLMWRGNMRNMERIFQLFANHTLNVEWVVPPTDSLLNADKYQNVDQDILTALGFPMLLITGEVQRRSTSNPEYASTSPIATMNSIRVKIRHVLQSILQEIATQNNFKTAPVIDFKPLLIADFKTFATSILALYDKGNISRSSIDKVFGFNWEDQNDLRAYENEEIQKLGTQFFSPVPFSNPPPGGNDAKPTQDSKPDTMKPKKNDDTQQSKTPYNLPVDPKGGETKDSE